MSAAKAGADQKRKFGFKETREEFELRKKHEKTSRWTEKLSKEDLSKLKKEIDSLDRARFLTPQQNERKRLVQRMIDDLEAGEKTEDNATAMEAPEQKVRDVEKSDSDDDIFFSRGTRTQDEEKRLFLPRSIRAHKKTTAVEEQQSVQQLAKDAEKELLAAAGDSEDLDSFLDSLR